MGHTMTREVVEKEILMDNSWDDNYLLFCNITSRVTQSDSNRDLAIEMFNLMQVFKYMDEYDKFISTGAGTDSAPSIDVIKELIDKYTGGDYDEITRSELNIDMPDIHSWCPYCKKNGCRVCKADPPIKLDNNDKTDRKSILSIQLLNEYIQQVNNLIASLNMCITKRGAKRMKMKVCPIDVAEQAIRQLEIVKTNVQQKITRLNTISTNYINICHDLSIPPSDEKPCQTHMLARMRFMILYPQHDISDIRNWFLETLSNVKDMVYNMS